MEAQRTAIVNVVRSVCALWPRPGLRSVELVGSWSKGQPRVDSDVDLLISFDCPWNYFEITKLSTALQEQLHRDVDIIDASTIQSPTFRESFFSPQNIKILQQ